MPLRSPKDQGNQPHKSGNRPVTEQDLVEFECRLNIRINNINNRLNDLTMNDAELAAGLRTIQAQVGKVATEQATRFDTLSARIKELEDAIAAGGDVPQDVVDALEGVKTSLQALDDTIPDPAPPTA